MSVGGILFDLIPSTPNWCQENCMADSKEN